MDLQFVSKVLVGALIAFACTFMVLSEPVQSSVLSAIQFLSPKKLTPEEIRTEQAQALDEAKQAFSDLDDIAEAGEGVKPDPVVQMGRSGSWAAPFFLPTPPTWNGEVAEEDVDRGRHRLRMRYLKSAMAFNTDRCSNDLRDDLMSAFRKYQRGYKTWFGSIGENDNIFWFATPTDQFIVGLQTILMGEGYLSLADYGLTRLPGRTPKIAGFRKAREKAEKKLLRRRACETT